MKNKRRRTSTKTVLTAVARVAVGLVLHSARCALLSAGFTYDNKLTLFGTTAPTLAIYHSFLQPHPYRSLPVLLHNAITVNNITLFFFSQY